MPVPRLELLATILKYICHLRAQSFLKPMAEAQEDTPAIVEVPLVLAGVVEELEVLERLAQTHKPPGLMLAAMAATLQSRVRRGLAELMVIR